MEVLLKQEPKAQESELAVGRLAEQPTDRQNGRAAKPKQKSGKQMGHKA
jgi:hypothetical protein